MLISCLMGRSAALQGLVGRRRPSHRFLACTGQAFVGADPPAWNNKMSWAATQGRRGSPQRHSSLPAGSGTERGASNSPTSKGVPGTLKTFGQSLLRLPNHESDSDHWMLPIRCILPIVGALFALALAPLGFSPQDSVRNTSVASVERPEPRQTIVPAGMQPNDDDEETRANLDAGDVTGNIHPTFLFVSNRWLSLRPNPRGMCSAVPERSFIRGRNRRGLRTFFARSRRGEQQSPI
jgi:hypothetical protein